MQRRPQRRERPHALHDGDPGHRDAGGLEGPQFATLEVQALMAEKPLQMRDNYFTNTCKIKM